MDTKYTHHQSGNGSVASRSSLRRPKHTSQSRPYVVGSRPQSPGGNPYQASMGNSSGIGTPSKDHLGKQCHVGAPNSQTQMVNTPHLGTPIIKHLGNSPHIHMGSPSKSGTPSKGHMGTPVQIHTGRISQSYMDSSSQMGTISQIHTGMPNRSQMSTSFRSQMSNPSHPPPNLVGNPSQIHMGIQSQTATTPQIRMNAQSHGNTQSKMVNLTQTHMNPTGNRESNTSVYMDPSTYLEPISSHIPPTTHSRYSMDSTVYDGSSISSSLVYPGMEYSSDKFLGAGSNMPSSQMYSGMKYSSEKNIGADSNMPTSQIKLGTGYSPENYIGGIPYTGSNFPGYKPALSDDVLDGAAMAYLSISGASDNYEGGTARLEGLPKSQGADGCSKCSEYSASTSSTSLIVYVDTQKLMTRHAKSETQMLLRYMNALLNDCGGSVCVHCSQPCPVAVLDQVVDERLMSMITNAMLYEDNFERLVVDNCHVVYRVKPSPGRCLSVLDFHSLMSSNRGLVQPTQAQIQTIICQRFPEPTQNSSRDPLENPSPNPSQHPSHNPSHNPSQDSSQGPPEPYRMNSYVEQPAFQYMQPVRLVPSCRLYLHGADGFDPSQKLGDYSESLAHYWWEVHGLGRVIAALCKQQTGGSIYFGISEEIAPPSPKWVELRNSDLGLVFPGCSKKIWVDRNKTTPNSVHYLARAEDVPMREGQGTGVYICQGVSLTPSQCDSFKKAILRKIRSEMLWYPHYPTRDPVQVVMHALGVRQGGGNERHVVELRVGQCQGLAFHDQAGLEAYGIRNVGARSQVCKLPLEEVVHAICQFTSHVTPSRVSSLGESSA